MIIWVDADSCPRQIREVVSRAALRLKIKTFFVANRKIPFPGNAYTQGVQVPAKEGSADSYIVQKSSQGDLAITRDIPLADSLLEKSLIVLNDRGDVYTPDNIKERLSIRDFMKDLRESGLQVPEHTVYGKKELRQFSNAFDREITKALKADPV